MLLYCKKFSDTLVKTIDNKYDLLSNFPRTYYMESLNDKILARCEGEVRGEEIIITNLEIIKPTSKVGNKVISLSPKQMMSILNRETNIIKKKTRKL